MDIFFYLKWCSLLRSNDCSDFSLFLPLQSRWILLEAAKSLHQKFSRDSSVSSLQDGSRIIQTGTVTEEPDAVWDDTWCLSFDHFSLLATLSSFSFLAFSVPTFKKSKTGPSRAGLINTTFQSYHLRDKLSSCCTVRQSIRLARWG